ncbi:uncharacterized protein ARMOST_02488 [Armillaria ostoyae]|uniref:Uncharacterized protein n=1 Tax=Armillaria ostoyae TaxID=47428 RepID=A0A284QRU8_ARMOS|nr:uncharacterized protein ARMOST_02488 [Armillaria ostoyae]
MWTKQSRGHDNIHRWEKARNVILQTMVIRSSKEFELERLISSSAPVDRSTSVARSLSLSELRYEAFPGTSGIFNQSALSMPVVNEMLLRRTASVYSQIHSMTFTFDSRPLGFQGWNIDEVKNQFIRKVCSMSQESYIIFLKGSFRRLLPVKLLNDWSCCGR